MRKTALLILVCMNITLSIHAQFESVDPNVLEWNYDGKDLVKYIFPEDENRNIKFSAIINCGLSADTIMGLAKDCVYDIEKRYNAESKLEFESKTKVAYHIAIPIGKEYFIIHFPYSQNELMDRALSKISFDVTIEPRQGKYRYLLTNFNTERYRIRGAGKSEGQSNFIHWQRVYSLTKEMPRRGKKRKSYEKLIEREKALYQAEYDTVQKVIAELESLANKAF